MYLFCAGRHELEEAVGDGQRLLSEESEEVVGEGQRLRSEKAGGAVSSVQRLRVDEITEEQLHGREIAGEASILEVL